MKSIFFILTSLILVQTSFGQINIYVDPVNGNDIINNGQLNAPFKTINKAFSLKSANGDAIILRAGIYQETELIWPESGTGLNPATLKNYPKEIPIIDGSNGTSNIMLLITSKSNILIDGIHFTNSVGNGSYGLKIDGNCNNITIQNCKISNIDVNEPDLSSSTNALPLKVCADSPNLINNVQILNNEVFDCKTGFSEGISIAGNVNGFLVKGNYVHDMSNIGIVAAGKYPNDCEGFAQNGKIIENIVSKCVFPTDANSSASGIYIDGAENIVAENNIVSECQVGIQIGCENPEQFAQNDTVRNNLIFHNIKWALGIGGTYGSVKNSAVVNNTTVSNNELTFVKNDTTYCGNFGEILIKQVENSIIANNLCFTTYSCSNAVFMKWENNGSLSGMTVDHNLYYNPGSVAQPIMVIRNLLNSTEDVYSFSTYQSWGYDTHSFISNPNLNNPTGQIPEVNFLNSTSDAINNGLSLSLGSSGITDFNGNARVNGIVDIGAIEFYNCPQKLKLFGVGLNGTVFKATDNIESVSELLIGNLNTFNAGKSISLNPGFKAENGSVFKAEIKNCP